MDMEKMIVVEKSTKWWLTVATGGALAVGLMGGYGLATAIHGTNNQQSAIQQTATMPGAPEQGQNAGNGMLPQPGQNGPNGGPGNGMPPQDGQQSDNDKSKNSSAQQNDNGKKNKKKSSTNTNEQSDKNNNKSTKENKTSQS